MELDNNMLNMENMEIDMDTIDNSLVPELPEKVIEFMATCVDKPY